MQHRSTQDIPLTTPQASEILGVKPTTLEIWRHQGKGPAYLKIGRAVRYRIADLHDFLDGSVRRSTSEY
jgi:excisionase family DNA binding protein